jgi:hypothetical protein
VDDPTVAAVDKDGRVTGFSSGTTTLTATMISSGQSVSIPVTVLEGDDTQTNTIEVAAGNPAELGNDQIHVPLTLTENLADDTVKSVEVKLDFNSDELEPDTDALPEGVSYDPQTKTLTVPVVLFGKLSAAGLTFKAKAASAEPSALSVKIAEVTPVDSSGNAVETVDVSVTNPSGEINPYYPNFPFYPGGQTGPFGPNTPFFPPVLPEKPNPVPEKPAEEIPVSEAPSAEPAPSDKSGYADFADLTSGAWYEESVRWALDNGIMNGTGPNTFAPDLTTTRAMVVTMLWRMEGEPLPWSDSAFDDVASDTWYSGAVAWAAENGIVTGYDADTFGPNDPVTRAQVAAMLMRFTGLARKGSGEAQEAASGSVSLTPFRAADRMKNTEN